MLDIKGKIKILGRGGVEVWVNPSKLEDKTREGLIKEFQAIGKALSDELELVDAVVGFMFVDEAQEE